MQCAYESCRREFVPSRKNQKYHARRCRERAKNARHLVVRVSAAEKRFLALARKRAARKLEPSVTPLGKREATMLRQIFIQAALWLGQQEVVTGARR